MTIMGMMQVHRREEVLKEVDRLNVEMIMEVVIEVRARKVVTKEELMIISNHVILVGVLLGIIRTYGDREKRMIISAAWVIRERRVLPVEGLQGINMTKKMTMTGGLHRIMWQVLVAAITRK
jgi:hypothetical protein